MLYQEMVDWVKSHLHIAYTAAYRHETCHTGVTVQTQLTNNVHVHQPLVYCKKIEF